MVIGAYRRLLWGMMRRLRVRDDIERKVLTAVVIQYASAFALFFLPVLFHGPQQTIGLFAAWELVVIGTIAVLATLAFANTAWIVRRDVVRPLVDMEQTATALADGRIDEMPSAQVQDDEIGSLQAAITDVHGHLQIVNARAAALSRELFETPILDEPVPGQLGDSLDTMERELRENIEERDRELERNERALRQLHRISAQTDLQFGEKLDELLALGCEYLGTEYGYIGCVDTAENTLEIIAATGDHEKLQSGETVPLDRTYCRRVVTTSDPISFESARAWVDDPAHDVFGFDSYLGRKIDVEGELYGTACFADPEPNEFSEFDRAFVDLVALWIGHEREREQRLRDLQALFDQSPDGIVVHNAEGKITDANERISDWLGYDREQLLGMTVTEFDPDRTQADITSRLAAIEPDTVEKTEGRYLRADGSTCPVEIWINEIERETEARTAAEDRYLSVVRDVTERRDRLQLLQILDRVLRHNVRNELTVISGYTEAIRTATDEVEESVTAISQASENLLHTVNKERELVDLIGGGPAVTEQEITEQIRQKVTTKREQYPEATIEVSCPSQLQLRAVPRLSRAVEELLDNACRHADHEQPQVRVTVEQDDDVTEIEISDDGPGIPETEISVLEGSSTDPLYHGSGLGLWLVYWLVEFSDGTVEFSHREPRGTVVTIRLPHRK